MDPAAFLINPAMITPIQIHIDMQECPSRFNQSYPTDYAQFVLNVLAKMTRDARAIDQAVLRRAIGLASSYLVTDASTNPDGGIATWQTWLQQAHRPCRRPPPPRRARTRHGKRGVQSLLRVLECRSHLAWDGRVSSGRQRGRWEAQKAARRAQPEDVQGPESVHTQ
ncbi:hypothetical protein J3R82DRAFT_4081 [Butyriboletus roseoflavus]|nr:hypothetical protein J3R82DRAFT_4081 [Butyriboletus roseoflavus]